MSDEIQVGPVQTKMPGNRCPHCGGNAEGGTAFDKGEKPAKKPTPGDFALCLYCGALNAYTDEMKLRPITERERKMIEQDPRLREVLEYAEKTAKKMRRQWQ